MNTMNRRDWLTRMGAAAGGLYGATLAGTESQAAKQPNIIFIFCDDLGWADLPCHGHAPLKAHGGWTMRETLKMPNLDRMAAEGTRFMQYYVNSAVCSPSRTGIMCGRFPSELAIHDYIASPQLNEDRGMPNWLDSSVHTAPRLLKNAGYTTGHFGKWHLGRVDGAPKQAEYGIDRYASCLDGPGKRPGSSEMIADETISFIKENTDRPFFINAWLYDPHSPLRPTEEHLAPYADLSPGWGDHLGAFQIWYAVLTNIDRQVGRIIDTLDELGLSEDTMVIFSSDNGAESGLMKFTSHYGGASATNTGPFRGLKRSLYEGGVREPFIVRWPGTVPEGRIDYESILSGVDLLPTYCALAGVTPPADPGFDGEDISSALTGDVVERSRPLMWENRFPVYGHAVHKSPMLAIRDGHWKLLINPDGSRTELYDIPNDPTELNNLAYRYPGIVDRLSKQVLAWQKTLPPGPVNPDAGTAPYPWPTED
jgi:arylsulfatase A-like enzyme